MIHSAEHYLITEKMNGTIFKLMELPYAVNELEPYISAKTIDFHHDKHHRTYLNNLNALIIEKGWFADNLESIIMQTYKNELETSVFNNAAQVWNHNFYWYSIKAEKNKKLDNDLLKQIEKDFGDFAKMREEFIKIGMSQFGSGWVWLVWDSKVNQLKITKTSNAEMPMLFHQKALLTSDVWEHAYYLDYQNRRKEYLEMFIDHLANWQFAQSNLNLVR